jgi:hypothetical protein
VLDLNGVTFSSRGIPIGTESEIDIATLQFTTPIFISPPTKVKKLGVITKIITSIFNEQTGNIDLGLSMPEMKAYSDETTDTARADINTTADGTVDTSKVVRTDADAVIGTTISDWDIVVLNSIVQIVDKGVVGTTNWRKVLDAYPGIYQAGISRILLERSDMESTVSGTFALNSLNENQIIVNWDADTIPTNTLINGVTNRGTVDYIIDPSTFNPTAIKIAGLRLLILSDIGAVGQVDGADAWKSTGGADLVAQTNDIIEWNGTQWNVLFDASANANSDDSTVTTIYTTNLNTGVQYKWNGATWLLSFEGEYRKGTWNLSL